MTTRLLALGAVLATGCTTYDEGLTVTNLTGTIVVPREAATRTVFDESGNPVETVDVRHLGPVYLGLYPRVAPEDGIQPYTHPAVGPVFEADVPGDTYPYGGTSVGDMRFTCLEYLQCKVVSGRFVDFDEMVDWFNNKLGQPIIDANGDVVTSGDYIAETCFELLNYVDESEIRLTATEDRNEDGAIDSKDLDFVEQSDGNFAAEFTIYQQEWFEDEECVESGGSNCGFALWGWMDAPSELTQKFTTCDPNDGYQETEYNRNFYAGRPYRDLLNHPSLYIAGGDFVATNPHVYSSPEDEGVTITLDYEVGAN